MSHLFRERFPQLAGLSEQEAEALVGSDPDLRDQLFQFQVEMEDRIEQAKRQQAEVHDRATKIYSTIMGPRPPRGLLDD